MYVSVNSFITSVYKFSYVRGINRNRCKRWKSHEITLNPKNLKLICNLLWSSSSPIKASCHCQSCAWQLAISLILWSVILSKSSYFKNKFKGFVKVIYRWYVLIHMCRLPVDADSGEIENGWRTAHDVKCHPRVTKCVSQLPDGAIHLDRTKMSVVSTAWLVSK